MNEIQIVVGSWGAYNACNERALGSSWLTLSKYSNWEEIEEELRKQGFLLDSEDEELFIQDIENFEADCNWDYVSPAALFEVLQESGVLYDDYKKKVLDNYLEVRSYSDFCSLVESYGENWDRDIILLDGVSYYDIGYDHFESCVPKYVIEEFQNYIDFEELGKDLCIDWYEECSDGFIHIE